jgi:hypothetical protein
MGAHTAACDFSASLPLLDVASRILRHRCVDVAWEQSLADEQRLLACFWLGRWKLLRDECPALVRHAQATGNPYWVNRFAGSYASFAAELADDVQEARRLVELGERALPADASAVQRFGQLWCATRHDLYTGNWRDAVARVDRHKPDLLGSFVLRVSLVGFTHTFDLARVFLLAAARDSVGRRQHLARARKAVRGLEGIRHVAFVPAVASCLRGLCAAIEGDVEGAVALLQVAEPALEASGLDGLVAAIRARRGQLVQGEEGAALQAGARSWMVGQGVQNPEAMIAMVLPSSFDGAGPK